MQTIETNRATYRMIRDFVISIRNTRWMPYTSKDFDCSLRALVPRNADSSRWVSEAAKLALIFCSNLPRPTKEQRAVIRALNAYLSHGKSEVLTMSDVQNEMDRNIRSLPNSITGSRGMWV